MDVSDVIHDSIASHDFIREQKFWMRMGIWMYPNTEFGLNLENLDPI